MRRLLLLMSPMSLLLALPARAEIELFQGDDVGLHLGGYAQTFAGLQVPDVEAGGAAVPTRVGVSSAILRAEWKLTLGERVVVDVHNRLAWLQSTEDLRVGTGQSFGIGVSAQPQRTVDLRSEIVDDERLSFEHDLDRLVLRAFLGDDEQVSLSVGRQAITWGQANLFPVADLWATFSPFDLDTAQKRGVDAVRAIVGLGQDAELDLLVVDRGSLDELSGGARLVLYLPDGDLYVAAAKVWTELALLAGYSATLEEWKLRAEIGGFYDYEIEEVERPRATLGADFFGVSDLVLGLELHYQGTGAADPEDYAQQVTGDRHIERGETYLLGRYYAGLLISWKPHELVTLSTTPLLNARDPSALIAWSAAYEVSQNVSLALGAFHGVGGALVAQGFGFELDSEFGPAGHLGYLLLSAFF